MKVNIRRTSTDDTSAVYTVDVSDDCDTIMAVRLAHIYGTAKRKAEIADIIELPNGMEFLILRNGYKLLTPTQYDEYLQMRDGIDRIIFTIYEED